MSGHRVELTRADPEDAYDVHLVCEEPEGALCRLFCDGGKPPEARQGCEIWWICEDCTDDDHPLGRHDTAGHPLRSVSCSAVEYIHNWSTPYDTCADDEINHEGPVDVEWTGEDWVWSYLRAPSPGDGS